MIGDVIKKIRKEHGLTQKDLADLLFVSDKTISSWENDRTVPDIYMLERISKMYHIPMNDLMVGEVSWFSKVKYRSKQIMHLVLSYVKKHVFITVVMMVSLISFLMLVILPPLTTYFFMHVVLFSSIVCLSIMFSKWFVILFFISISMFIQDSILILNPSRYGELIDSQFLLVFEQLFSFSFLGILILMIFYTLYLLIKKHHTRFYYITSIGVILIWLFVVILYDKTLSLSYHYSSFTNASTYIIKKNEYFILYTLSYHLIITGINLLLFKIKQIFKT
ncbi:MAG: hypothetical protein A2Y45_04275 [Tenericutes bacterium GWC2_34_14]|nr:MAG: hypothetical protein A2Z84_08170 [Tenericutes bacterium GWA2_35_7]OHE28818.1 MAG: hypothetical protein A2Y45_04275 [Tenericutes bacterium GWC2_34_14]OHE33286.1 MAG: hypothetical protein A2012_06055 [Tenericutes bacterium GWE2_34_108]OHE36436.1 MAG: hypothetical protein A2Y46_08160 [Tenericutes bacterium GWF1_35_14]OHE37640.1 MAG: hypothetical protein A2Y44_03085 [Tenericutes bacterium GWF2_35_184]OHE45083.1 MAG: hypothetical protein A2221_02425 [Tenericutes bacterium RIFOXYA2_FULL_36_3